MTELLYCTKSVCPVCLKALDAEIVAREDGIYMRKTCPEHGAFDTLIWADTKENYLKWLSFGGIDVAALPHSPEAAESRTAGRDFSCKACVQPVSAALMTTNRCNMDCPVCFTRDKREPLYEPGLDDCRKLMEQYRAAAGETALLELCGGEPTARGDICELAATARDLGFDFIQLNTNGILLAESAAFCRKLRASGVTTVYMGFDGISEKPYLAKYGKPMLETKMRALQNCAEAGLAVVLVTCVIPGENDGELGGIVRLAAENMPTVKGVFFQPISYFGIYPRDKIRRITIPDIIRGLEAQAPELKAEDFGPGAYEHAQCSFQACYMQDKQGRLRALTHMSPRKPEQNACEHVRQSVRATWLPSERRLLTIGGMAFQDGWNADLLRVQRCSVQIIQKDGGLVPLCGKYLSGCDGSRLLPGIS